MSPPTSLRNRWLAALGLGAVVLGASTATASFPDVPPDAFYAEAVAWAVANDITTGFGQTGNFQPDLPTTRGQMVTFLKRLDDKLARSARTNGNRIDTRDIALLRWDRDPGRPTTVGVGSQPRGLAFDGQHVWVASTFGGVTRINPANGTVVAEIDVIGQPGALAFDGVDIWVTRGSTNQISRISRATNQIVQTIPVGLEPRAIAFDGTHLWVANLLSDSVTRYTTAGAAVGSPINVPLPRGLAFDGTHMWVATIGASSVTRINVTTLASTTVALANPSVAVAHDGAHIWVTHGSFVTKVDPVTASVMATVLVETTSRGVAYDGHHVWVANQGSGTVSQVNPMTNTVTATITTGLGSSPGPVLFDGTGIWVGLVGQDLIRRIEPS